MNFLFNRLLVLITFILLSFQAIAASPDNDRITQTLESLRLAINAHDYNMLKPSLDGDFSYQGRDQTMSTMIMQQVVNQYPQEIDTIEVVSISESDDGWNVAILLEGKEPSKQREVIITDNYLIRQADIADIQLKGH
jgi:hypothetical protein